MALKEQGEFEALPGIRLYKGDRAKLEAFYPEAGYNKVIRRLVRNHISKLEAKFEQRVAAKSLFVKGEEYEH